MALGRLKTASLVFLGVYIFVMFVSFVTSGRDLVKEPDILYPVLAPPLAALGFLASSYMRRPARRMLYAGTLAHVLAVVSFFHSFLFLGFGLIAVSYFWWRAYLSSKSEREGHGPTR
jgi:hypothetical protein